MPKKPAASVDVICRPSDRFRRRNRNTSVKNPRTGSVCSFERNGSPENKEKIPKRQPNRTRITFIHRYGLYLHRAFSMHPQAETSEGQDMDYRIAEVTANKKKYLDLLLLADEQEDMIDRYLDDGSLFVLDDEGVKCVAVVVALNAEECELKNIATYPEHQNKGYGKAMVDYLSGRYLGEFETMYVGTGDVPKILRFYERCGFHISHRDENFFIDNYDHPMFEDVDQFRDMVYLRKDV